jgi:hypothetical protein
MPRAARILATMPLSLWSSVPDSIQLFPDREFSIIVLNLLSFYHSYASKKNGQSQTEKILAMVVMPLDRNWNIFLEYSSVVRGKLSILIASLALFCGGIFVVVRPADSATSYLANNIQGEDFMSLIARAQSAGANELILQNSRIGFNLGYASPMPVILQGYVVFVIPGMPAPGDYVMLSNVSGFNESRVLSQTGLSQMFDTEILWRDDSMVLSVLRITDYERILDSAEGRFLNQLRNSGANPELMSRLDGAMSMENLKSIMDNSVALRPAKLMNPEKLLARFQDTAQKPCGITSGTAIIFGEDLVLYSGWVGVRATIDNMSLGVSVRVGEFFNTGIEEYSGLFYGLDISGRLDTDYLYVAAMAGGAFANFQTGPVHDGNGGATSNPSGIAIRGAVEFGAKAFDDDRFYITPIIRARGYSAHVLSDSDSEISVGIGSRAGYKETNMGIETFHGAYGIIEKDGGQFGVRTDIRSKRDGLSVHLDAAVLYIDLGRFYKLGAGVTLEF